MVMPNEVLQVSQNASVSEIRKAYRALARRWHPDRFAAGPERDWANERMCEINRAYRAMLRTVRSGESDDSQTLTKARALMDDGRLNTARELLMTIPTRCAEWNYLFGEILMRLREYNKAIIYLSVAAHQKPDSPVYSKALTQARSRVASEGASSRLRSLLHR